MQRNTPEYVAQRLINIGLGRVPCDRRLPFIIVALDRLAWCLMAFMSREDAAMHIWSLGDKIIVSKEAA